MARLQGDHDAVLHRSAWSLPSPPFCLANSPPGRLNQAEFSERIDPILLSPNGDREHLHNQLLAAIYGNVTREMPDLGLAPWVSANDKPSSGVGSKQTSGDAAERRLKGEVMQLAPRDRRRLKDLVHNDVRLPAKDAVHGRCRVRDAELTVSSSLTRPNPSPTCLPGSTSPGCRERPTSPPAPVA